MDTRIRNGILTVAALAFLPAGVAAQQEDEAAPEGVTAETVAAGKKLYSGAGMCSVCHGANLEGGVGPNLANDTWLHSKGTYDKIVTQILEGVSAGESKSGVPMPPKGGSSISEEQVRAVAAYVWSLSHPKAEQP
jgi:mono/diheme cytochrome c family protein